jgi:glycosidase
LYNAQLSSGITTAVTNKRTMRFPLLFDNMITSSMRYFWLRLAEIRRIDFCKTSTNSLYHIQLFTGVVMAIIKKMNNTIIIIVSKWDDICNEIRLVKFGYKP